MRDGTIGQKSQCIGQGNTIITAQSRSFRKDTAAIMHHIQALVLHIDITVFILLTDHVHMPLKDNRICILQTASAILENDNIVQIILLITKIVFLCKADQIVADQLRITGAMRDRTNFFKISKHTCRLQSGKFFGFNHNITPYLF